MNTSESSPTPEKARLKWPIKTLIEILPLIIALTAVFSYSTIKNVTGIDPISPLTEVVGGVPVWVTILMVLVALVGCCGMGWLIYLFSRAPVSVDGSDED